MKMWDNLTGFMVLVLAITIVVIGSLTMNYVLVTVVKEQISKTFTNQSP